MEITNIPKLTSQKAEETQKVKVPQRADNPYATAKATEDSADISAKARQMLSLRESYSKLEQKESTDIKKVQQKLEESGVRKLSSEEIVSSILQGTLFEAV
jgi:hypothetical protein